MSNLSGEQVLDIADLINGRLLEYGEGMFEPLRAGVVRLAFDEIERWMATHDYLNDDAPRPMPPTAPNGGAEHGAEALILDGYNIGFARGRAMPRRELGIFESEPETPRLVTMSAPAPPLGADPPDAPPQKGNEKSTDIAPDLLAEGISDIMAGIIATVVPKGGAEHGMTTAPDPPKNDEKLTDTAPGPSGSPAPPLGEAENILPLVPRRLRTIAEVDAETEQLAAILATDIATATDQVDELRGRIIRSAQAHLHPSEGFPGTRNIDGAALPEQDDTDHNASVELAATRMSKDEKSAQLREIIGVLQDMADGETMPSMAAWDKGRPEHLPSARLFLARRGLTWEEMARYAKLKFAPKPGPAPGTRKIVSGDPT